METENFNLRNPKEAKERLIVALDVATKAAARKLVSDLHGEVSFFKVGYQLFLAEGMSFVRELIAQGNRVFLDLKMDDVEETIMLAVREMTKNKVSFLTIQGNTATARAAVRGRGQESRQESRQEPRQEPRPHILSVTLLTSLNDQDLRDLGLLGETNKKFASLDEYVDWRAEQALQAECDGLIAAGPSVSRLRAKHPQAIIVTPGVRLAGLSSDEHKRPTTPKDAIVAGSDYLVVGRPIRDAPERRAVARRIIDDIKHGLTERNGSLPPLAHAS